MLTLRSPSLSGLAVNGVVSYLASDGLGSANVTLSASGSATASQLYAPYGGIRYNSGTMPGTYGFTGQRADAASGLDYYGSRYYDPLASQFMSADSLLLAGGFDLWGLSRYAYVSGNPIARTDPTGRRNVVTGDDGGTCDLTDPSCGGGQPDPPAPSGGGGGDGGGGDGGGHQPCWMTGGVCVPPTPPTPPSPAPSTQPAPAPEPPDVSDLISPIAMPHALACRPSTMKVRMLCTTLCCGSRHTGETGSWWAVIGDAYRGQPPKAF